MTKAVALAVLAALLTAAPVAAETIMVPSGANRRPVVVIIRDKDDPPAEVFVPHDHDWVIVNRTDDTPVTVYQLNSDPRPTRLLP